MWDERRDKRGIAGTAAVAAAVGLAALLGSPGRAGPGDGLTPAEAYDRLGIARQPWQYPRAEGANCLYLLLRLYGREADHGALAARAGELGRAVRLDDLRDWAAERGLAARVVRPGPGGLDRLSLPAVVPLVVGGDDRYGLLARDAAGSLVLVDGSLGHAAPFVRETFLTQWTGEALVAGGPAVLARRVLAELGRIWPVLAGLTLLLLAWSLRRRRRGRWARGRRLTAGTASPGSGPRLVLPPGSGTGFRLLLILAALAAAGGAAPGQDEAARDELVKALLRAAQQADRLPGLDLTYRVERDLPARAERSSEHWPWPWAEIVTRLRPGEPGKLFVRGTHPDTSGRFGGEPTFEVGYSDGELVADVGLSKQGAMVARLSRVGRRPPAAYAYDYYFRGLGHPFTLPRDAGVGARSLADARDDWLADVLARAGSEYRLRPAPETVGGVSCRVLERPGRDVLWVEDGPVPRLRQRHTFWADGGTPRRQVTLSDYRVVAPGVELPWAMNVVLFGAPWDEPDLRGRPVSRLAVKVTALSAAAVPDKAFRAKLAPMMEVIDLVGTDDEFTFHNRVAGDPFDATLVRLAAPPGFGTPAGWLGRWAGPLGLGLLVLSALLAVGLLRSFRAGAKAAP